MHSHINSTAWAWALLLLFQAFVGELFNCTVYTVCSEALNPLARTQHMYTLIAGAASLLSNYEMIMLMMLHVDLLQEKIC